MHTQTNTVKGEMQLADLDNASELLAYPIDMSSFLTLPHCTFDLVGIPCHRTPMYNPNTIELYALAHWNQYLATKDEDNRKTFLAQAYWLVTHVTSVDIDTGGWPIILSHPDEYIKGPWLSAPTQGRAISVLVRAYQLTREVAFLEVAHRAVRTFQLDILDGGVSAPLGEEGVLFEEVAVYPAAHTLSGFIFGLFGLYDYVAITDDVSIKHLIHRSLTTMHSLLVEFDTGFWTRSDLLHWQLASSSEIALQVVLLEALAKYSGCDHCSTLASRWKRYQRLFRYRLHYFIRSRCTRYGSAFWNRIRRALFHNPQGSDFLRVCVPITAFPVTGGMRTVLARIAQVTEDIWQLEYLTQHIGPDSKEFAIHRFGTASMFPSQFPNVWLYVLAGFWKLISLLRSGTGYHVILVQDGVFTAAFAALVAKIAGVRCVCIEHGNLGLLNSSIHNTERIKALETRYWLYRLLAHLRYLCYWPSLYLLAWFATHLVDHFLIPGVAGDGTEETCQRFGVHFNRITRFANVINVDRHIILDAESRAGEREKNGIPANAIVISMICRLAPEKGLDIALEAISQALFALSPDKRELVRVIFAGDGPLRIQLEADIRKRELDKICILWGEASEETVISLLSLSDIFLFTSRRATGYPLAILEAMASSCAVIASSEPLANSRMLAEGRGIVVPMGDAEQTGLALVRLLNDLELCRHMGSLARNYVAENHNATAFKRILMQTTYWSPLERPLCGEEE